MPQKPSCIWVSPLKDLPISDDSACSEGSDDVTSDSYEESIENAISSLHHSIDGEDYILIQSSFDDLVAIITSRHSQFYVASDKHRDVPIVFVKLLCDMEDYFINLKRNREKINKLSVSQATALNWIGISIKKQCKIYENEIDRYRAKEYRFDTVKEKSNGNVVEPSFDEDDVNHSSASERHDLMTSESDSVSTLDSNLDCESSEDSSVYTSFSNIKVNTQNSVESSVSETTASISKQFESSSESLMKNDESSNSSWNSSTKLNQGDFQHQLKLEDFKLQLLQSSDDSVITKEAPKLINLKIPPKDVCHRKVSNKLCQSMTHSKQKSVASNLIKLASSDDSIITKEAPKLINRKIPPKDVCHRKVGNKLCQGTTHSEQKSVASNLIKLESSDDSMIIQQDKDSTTPLRIMTPKEDRPVFTMIKRNNVTNTSDHDNKISESSKYNYDKMWNDAYSCPKSCYVHRIEKENERVNECARRLILQQQLVRMESALATSLDRRRKLHCIIHDVRAKLKREEDELSNMNEMYSRIETQMNIIAHKVSHLKSHSPSIQTDEEDATCRADAVTYIQKQVEELKRSLHDMNSIVNEKKRHFESYTIASS